MDEVLSLLRKTAGLFPVVMRSEEKEHSQKYALLAKTNCLTGLCENDPGSAGHFSTFPPTPCISLASSVKGENEAEAGL